MSIPKLLPQGSLKWLVVHKLSKPILINSLGYLRDMFKDVIAEKQVKGWVNPEAQILYDIITVIMERDEIMRGGEGDHIRQFWANARDIGVTIADEDSHYMLRFLYLIELLHEFYPLFKIEMHRARAYWDIEQITEGMKKNDPQDKKAGYSKTYEILKTKLEMLKNADKTAGNSLPDNTGSGSDADRQ